MNTALLALPLALVAALVAIALVARRKGILHWLPEYLHWSFRRRPALTPTHVIFCLVDHYEPRWGGARDMPRERARVARWVQDYPRLASRFVDSDGVHPRHTFFFPEEEYEEEHLDALGHICAGGFGEIEVHLHHDRDTSDSLRRKLTDFAETLHTRHGALSRDPESGELRYAFIHGNWVLDNSDPAGRWCGVNDEITVLRETGCYADFTFPCAPHRAQPRQINSIYYATDDPCKPKSHDRGRPARVGAGVLGDLLLITGPLLLNWRQRKGGFMPRIENADLRSSNPPTPERVDLWVNAGIGVEGRPDWVFVKVHTHGAPEREADTLLGEPVDAMHRHLTSKYNDGERYRLHYVSAREMYNIAKAAEAGHSGNPNDFRDFILPQPRNLGSAASRADAQPATGVAGPRG